MKLRTTAQLLAVALSGVASPAFAAAGARQDNSGLASLVFLGFCALIVVAQLVPAVLVALGIGKGAVEAEAKTAEVRSK